MLDIFRGLKSLIKISHIHIDSAVFRLHYSLTVILLIAFSLIVTTRQYVGNPIDCIHSKDLPEDVLNTYCWIHSTYTITAAYRKREGLEVPFPGVDNSKSYSESERKEYKYYQWVCFMLFLQLNLFGANVTHRCYASAGDHGETCTRFLLFIPDEYLKSIFSKTKPRMKNCVVYFRLIFSAANMITLSILVGKGKEKKRGTQIYFRSRIFLFSLQRRRSLAIMLKAANRTIGLTCAFILCFFIILVKSEAILFYTPRWLWKGWEGGKIHALMMDLDIGLCSEVEKKQKKKMLLDYLWENLRFHNWWAYRYYLCEVLALLNVIGQMFLMNRFFDGAFLTFGIDVLRFLESDQEDRVDPMIYVFPRMTKCTFYKYGVSGEVERHDAVCILPLNVVNEKIYVFLWFWFLLLGVLSFFTVLYRILIIFSPRTRVYLLRMRFRLVRRDAVETIVRRSKVGDWFLLYMLGENLDTVIYRDVMHELANKLASRHHHGVPGVKGELQEA
ncbi:Innexin shaking-B [Trachymyrmex zeteki]|uniref:Innexin n=1 Tax=Mycetomoellerius zeteki TaxID=64791 RepID=A0A151XAY2_9HYME|nr:Innexin shaking-B [Trachymyrmex zeteki]